jgi:predicted alpha/beta hydrolase
MHFRGRPMTETISVHSDDKTLTATDGYPIAATCFESPGSRPPSSPTVVVLMSATGVRRRHYRRFAAYLAERGIVTVTFDYRGIGDSTKGPVETRLMAMLDWGTKDAAGVIAWARRTYAPKRLVVVGHSAGGQLVGVTPNHDLVDGLLGVAAQSGYWRLWPARDRYLMALLWYIGIPGATALLPYFPSRWFGAGENLPRGIARQWARWCRSRHYILSDGEKTAEQFAAYRGRIRAYLFSDDRTAPPAAVRALLSFYTHAPREVVCCRPVDVAADRIGHFGFFREQFRATLWDDAVAWIIDPDAPPRFGTREPVNSGSDPDRAPRPLAGPRSSG